MQCAKSTVSLQVNNTHRDEQSHTLLMSTQHTVQFGSDRGAHHLFYIIPINKAWETLQACENISDFTVSCGSGGP